MTLEMKRRIQKRESILNWQVEGEGFISSSAREWKMIVLTHFNQVQRKDITVEELLVILKDKGIVFEQKDSLVIYPVRECLKRISKVTGKEIDI